MPLFAVAVVLLVRNRRYGAGAVPARVACGGSLVINGTMKLLFERPRPQLPYAHVLPDYSFPSGHTMNGSTFYVALALIVWSVFGRRIGADGDDRRPRCWRSGSASAGSTSAIHYLTDVVGGILAGTAWLLIVGAAFRVRPNWWSWGRVARPEPRPASAPPRGRSGSAVARDAGARASVGGGRVARSGPSSGRRASGSRPPAGPSSRRSSSARRSSARRPPARSRRRFDVVVAVGGDGAVLQVVQVLAETDVALGIVPMGTGNLLAGNLGIPHEHEHAGRRSLLSGGAAPDRSRAG